MGGPALALAASRAPGAEGQLRPVWGSEDLPLDMAAGVSATRARLCVLWSRPGPRRRAESLAGCELACFSAHVLL